MATQSNNIQSQPSSENASVPQFSRRKNGRYPFNQKIDWDFFTSSTGLKDGFLENLSEGGCLLRTTETIEHRRWIRLVVKEERNNVWFTAVGRIIRRENRIEPLNDTEFTLYRYGIEFVHILNPLVLYRVRETSVVSNCYVCGNASASIPDINANDRFYCVLCHMRAACQTLLAQAD